MSRRPLLILALAAVSCVHSYDVPDTDATGVDPRSIIYVSRARDGRDNRPRNYHGSGAQVTEAIVNALHARGYRVLFGSETEEFDNAFVTARDNGASYVIFPRITLWEDRLTEWSGLRDTIHITIRTMDLDRTTIDSRRLEAHSRWLTLGGDHPEDLLPELIEDWASDLF